MVFDAGWANRAELDKRQMRRAFGRAAPDYDSVAALQRRAGAVLLRHVPYEQRFAYAADVGCGTGFIAEQLLRTRQCQRVLALDIALPMLQVARNKLAAVRAVDYVCGDAEALPLSSAVCELVVSNLSVQWCKPLVNAAREMFRVLRPQGLLALSSFGPTTLYELKQAWRAVDDRPHVNDFETIESAMAALQAAGFSRITASRQCETAFYCDVTQLMHELKGLGAHNIAQGRKRSLTKRRDLQTMCAAYETLRTSAGLPATFELIYLTAYKT